MQTLRITPTLRTALFTAWGGKCAYCGDEPEHVDHIHPKAKGGRDELENYAPACRRCNRRKSAMEFDDQYAGFMLQLAKRHAPEAKRLMDVSARKLTSRAQMVQRIRRRVTIIDLDLPLIAINWIAQQCDSNLIERFSSIDLVDAPKEVCRALLKARPQWLGPFHGGPLIIDASEHSVGVVLVDPLLIRSARVASKLKVSVFEFDGEIMPENISACRALL